MRLGVGEVAGGEGDVDGEDEGEEEEQVGCLVQADTRLRLLNGE